MQLLCEQKMYAHTSSQSEENEQNIPKLNIRDCVSLQGTNTFYWKLMKGNLFHILSNGTLDHFLFPGLSFTPGNSTLNLNGSTQKPQVETLK